MTVGTIVIDWDPERTDSDICDDLLEHVVVIAEIGTRPTNRHRARAISEELKQRPEQWRKKSSNVLLLTYVVNSEGRICTYETMDHPDNCDVFDVLFLSDVNGIGTEAVEIAIEKLTVEWRQRGKPNRCTTYFEYDLEDDEEEDA